MSVRRATCIALAVGTMSFLGSAQALVIDWHTHTGAGGTPYVTSGSNASIVYTFTAPGGQTLKTKAYQTGAANGTGAWTKAQTTIYSGGLGVKYPNSSENCPEHAVDTQGVDDILVFEFGATDYFPVKLGIGWPTASSNCGSQVDQDVKAWVGGSSLASAFDFTGFQVSQLTAANGWTDLGPYNVSVAGGGGRHQPHESDRTLSDRQGVRSPRREFRLHGIVEREYVRVLQAEPRFCRSGGEGT